MEKDMDVVEKIEEISLDSEGNVDPASLEYNEYRNDLNQIYRTTSQDNSLLSTFIVDGNICKHTLIIKYKNGQTSIEKEHTFSYSDSFKNSFLFSMLEDYNKYNKITKDNAVVKQDGTATFTVHTMDNDDLVIDNIDIELASKLSDIVYDKDRNNTDLIDSKEIMSKYSQRGIGTSMAILLVVLLIAVVFIGLTFIKTFFK